MDPLLTAICEEEKAALARRRAEEVEAEYERKEPSICPETMAKALARWHSLPWWRKWFWDLHPFDPMWP